MEMCLRIAPNWRKAMEETTGDQKPSSNNGSDEELGANLIEHDSDFSEFEIAFPMFQVNF